MAKDKKLVEAITSMDVDFAQWYTDVVKKAELIEYSSVKVQHLKGSFFGFFCCGMGCMAFLPEEFSGAQERSGLFFPADNRAPLIVAFGQIAVRLDVICIEVAEQCL